MEKLLIDILLLFITHIIHIFYFLIKHRVNMIKPAFTQGFTSHCQFLHSNLNCTRLSLFICIIKSADLVLDIV